MEKDLLMDEDSEETNLGSKIVLGDENDDEAFELSQQWMGIVEDVWRIWRCGWALKSAWPVVATLDKSIMVIDDDSLPRNMAQLELGASVLHVACIYEFQSRHSTEHSTRMFVDRPRMFLTVHESFPQQKHSWTGPGPTIARDSTVYK